MTWPAPHPSSHALPPVPVETVNAGDLLLLAGQWLSVRAAGVDGPRVTVVVPGRALPLRYLRGELVTVLRPFPQQMANPAFLDTLGAVTFRSRLIDRILDRLGWQRRRRPT